MAKIFDEICKIKHREALLNSSIRLLSWDQETQMPEDGVSIRSEQNKLLNELAHKLKTSKKLGKLLSEASDLSNLSEEQKASLREMRRDYAIETKLPLSFVKKFSEATTKGLDAWKKARSEKSFKIFAPHLKKIFQLAQEKAHLLGFEQHPYNALLDLYEPSVTVSKLDNLFEPLKGNLTHLLKKIGEKPSPKVNITGPFPIDRQRELATGLVKDMGLPLKNYCLMESAHPFCESFSSKDVRMTTHYHEDHFGKGFFAVMHESGHALYEHNLPFEHFGTPLGEPASHGIHESQSRIWETFIGHSLPFWKYYFPKVQKLFPEALSPLSLDAFYHSLNECKATFIRIYADEVTYNLHIILRYEMEKGLLDGSIAIKDIPELWNTKMESLLGITPKHDAEGCLQDVHWSMGLIGYFPSYTLGNLYAGALYQKLLDTHPDYHQKVASGDFAFIRTFLNDAIFKHGRRYPPIQLIEKATGKPFSSEPYLNYLKHKYA